MKIAVTGGIGTGKSEVMKIIKRLGYVTASADEINAALLTRPDYIQNVADAFPSAVNDGVVDKVKLREIIFNDKNERSKLNAIAHPLIRREIASVYGEDVFVEVPLLYESGMDDLFDKVIVVTAPTSLRIKRICARSGVTKELAKKMISSQMSDNERKKKADFVFNNKGTLSDLYTSITRVLARLK